MFEKIRFSMECFKNMTHSIRFTGVDAALEEDVASTTMPSDVPEANVRGDMIPQTPKDHGKEHQHVSCMRGTLLL